MDRHQEGDGFRKGSTHPTTPRLKRHFTPVGQITENLSSPHPKNIPLSPSGKSALPARPIPRPQEGRIAIVTDVGCGMRWTRRRGRRALLAAYGEVVWSWRPDAGVKSSRS